MKYYASLFEFSCEIFGYENLSKINKSTIDLYYKDWNNTNLSLKQYKMLLKSK